MRSLLCHCVVEEGKQERKRVREEERVRGTRGREERRRGASPKCGDRRIMEIEISLKDFRVIESLKEAKVSYRFGST